MSFSIRGCDRGKDKNGTLFNSHYLVLCEETPPFSFRGDEELNEDMQTRHEESLFHRVDVVMLAFWGTVILAFWLRFYDLANMPLHHDESLYGVYCWRFFTGQGYRYDPMMHGPFMFHFQVLVFFLLGVTDFSVRFAPALFGGLLVASTYYLKNYVGKLGIVCIALIITFSPTHLYFSRFMRHDSYSAFFTFLTVVFGLLYYRTRQRKHLYIAAAALSLMFCVKENAYIHTFIFLSFLFVKDVCQTYFFHISKAMDRKQFIGWGALLLITITSVGLMIFFAKRPLPAGVHLMEKSTWAAFLLILTQICVAVWIVLYWIFQNARHPHVSSTREALYPPILAAFVFVWIYIFLYSTFFWNRSGVVDGLAGSWLYWWKQHSIQRIKGPFHYYVPFLALYEIPVVLVALGGVLYRLSRTLNGLILTVWATLFSLGLILYRGGQPLPLWLAFTHMEIWFDLILTCYVLFIGLWAALFFLRRGETLKAFFIYWAGLGFLIYSYAGEKVPWLLLHIMLPIFVLAGLMLRDCVTSEFWKTGGTRVTIARFAAIAIGTVCVMYTLHTTIPLNYDNRANPVERMVYTQTSTDILKLMEMVRDVTFKIGAEEAKKPVIAVQGIAVWPLHWYLRDYDGWFHPGDLHEANRRPMAVIDWEARKKYEEAFAEEYQEIRVKLREWWIPGPNGTLADWWRYVLRRDVFTPTGSSDIAFYVRKDLL